jgi:hypothetical protein
VYLLVTYGIDPGQKNNEAQLPDEKQHEVLKLRGKHTPHHLMATDARQLHDKLSDPHVFAAFEALSNDDNTKCFLSLYKAAVDGQLKDERTFHDLCAVFNDQLKRKHSDNKNKKFGQRYPTNYLNFMILMRSRGGSTARQYGILTGQLGGPSPRHIRYSIYVYFMLQDINFNENSGDLSQIQKMRCQIHTSSLRMLLESRGWWILSGSLVV